MILYQGSNMDITEIDLSRGNKYKDFGRGFYLTPDRETAIRMAKKKTRLFKGMPIVITYEFDELALNSDMRIRRFPEKATAEWLILVANQRDRNCKNLEHGFDIVIGPIADDGVVLTLEKYANHIYTAEQAAIELQDKYLDQQYYFGTSRALTFLTKVKVEVV